MVSKPPLSHPYVPQTRRGLGLTLLTRIKNPSSLARELYLSPDAAPHTFLSGKAAEDLCQDSSQIIDPGYYFTKKRWVEHRRGLGLPETPLPPGHEGNDEEIPNVIDPAGNTVGAVALDVRGCIASVTSTGGKTNKLVGRIGDTPCMGSGFWAEEWEPRCSWPRKALGRVIPGLRKRTRAIGVSGTGNGDYFIRLATGSTIGHRMKYLGKSLRSASQFAVEELRRDGGEGGVIALDNQGNASLILNCPGMYRGIIRKDGTPKTAIFAEEELTPTSV
jgi:beta-aspartyl-peptidase (threonine type)